MLRLVAATGCTVRGATPVIRSFTISTLALTLALPLIAMGTGCKPDKPAGTTPPGENGGVAEEGNSEDSGDSGDSEGEKKKEKKGLFGKKRNKDKSKDEGDADAGGGESLHDKLVKTECPAEVTDPASFFADGVLLRLPKGVSAESYMELSPSELRLSSQVESVSCVEGEDVAGAMITLSFIFRYEDDTNISMTEWRDKIVKAVYQDAAVSFSEEKSSGRKLEVAIDVPEGNGNPPGKAWLVFKGAHGYMHAVLYETHPDAWNAMKATFKQSGKKLLPIKQ